MHAKGGWKGHGEQQIAYALVVDQTVLRGRHSVLLATRSNTDRSSMRSPTIVGTIVNAFASATADLSLLILRLAHCLVEELRLVDHICVDVAQERS